MEGPSIYEICKVGNQELIREVIQSKIEPRFRSTMKLVRKQIPLVKLQLMSNAAGVGARDPASRTGKPLSVEPGPGLMETIYDSTQRSLKSIADKTTSVYIPRGIALPALDREKKWEFTPTTKEGEYVSGGDVWDKVVENSLLNEHRILMPPRAHSIIKKRDEYTVAEPLLAVDFNGEEKEYMMMQTWHVRVPRPVKERLTANSPLIVGQRVLDALYTSIQGGTVCIRGAFGCGKTVISQSVSKFRTATSLFTIVERDPLLAEIFLSGDMCIVIESLLTDKFQMWQTRQRNGRGADGNPQTIGHH